MTLLEGDSPSDVVSESLALEKKMGTWVLLSGRLPGRPVVANPLALGISSDRISAILMVCGSERNVFYSRV